MATFNTKQIKQIEERGSSVETVAAQVERFRTGFPWMKIVAPATPGRGILVLSQTEAEEAAAYYDKSEVDGKCKFVPASGAASRMFKDIFSGLAKLRQGEDLDAGAPASKLAAQIEKFAFFDEDLFGKPEDSQAYRLSTAAKVLTEEGLNYGSKPKGVLKFHKYPDGETRTAFAEHLVEAQNYMKNADGSANLVVTISPEHRELFEAALAEVCEAYEKKYGVKYNITFTYQDKATDTVAVDHENNPFLDEKGDLLFRPAGHGALIYNLNKVDAELVSIKNIDNVATEKYLPITATYKKVLMGKALELRDIIHGYLRDLDAVAGLNPTGILPTCPGLNNDVDTAIYNSPECKELCDEIEEFLDRELCVKMPKADTCKERVEELRKKLDRPIRVCGMVRNQGEPGGGPFIIEERDGSTSLQILESVQLDMNDPRSKELLAQATHFNPVDIVCCLKDYRGGHINLLDHVDQEAGFISSKSYQGRELKALELPGLWNGSMSDWNTAFVEVPLDTFNPVKVVLDLLREAHQ